MKRLIGAVVAVTLLGALFVTSFLGAFRQPEPHDVPIAVVGQDQVVARLEQQVAAQAPGAFDLIGYPDAAAARQALLDREVDAVLAPQERTLTVASAAGRTGAAIITAAFQAAIPGLTVQDAVPLPPGDPGGVAGMFYLMGLLIPGIVLAVLVTRSGARPAARLGALLGGALVIGTANALLADVVFGALPDRLAALAALSAGIVAALGLVVAGLARTVGLPGVPVATLLFFPDRAAGERRPHRPPVHPGVVRGGRPGAAARPRRRGAAQHRVLRRRRARPAARGARRLGPARAGAPPDPGTAPARAAGARPRGRLSAPPGSGTARGGPPGRAGPVPGRRGHAHRPGALLSAAAKNHPIRRDHRNRPM